ncbi:MAG: DNA-processing protein DprA [Lachnospiraceae bacterium]|nr:DNA-processing protein DprA [Lachnospiraceae bacterium]
MNNRYSENDKSKMEQARQLKAISAQYGISYCTLEDERYPSELRKIVNRPPVLYYRGDIEIMNQNKNLAVIGSRNFSAAGAKLSYHTGKIIGKSGFNLVNGLAIGCDTEALKGALSANGRCIAIMPCGLEQIQPKSNQKLAEAIVEKGGCLLSEYPVGTRLEKYRYVERDRLQSGVSQGVLVVEAEEKSGTMHTARFALSQCKRLACYWYKMLEFSSGNQYLEEGKKAQILKSEQDLMNFIKSISSEEYEQISFEFI